MPSSRLPNLFSDHPYVLVGHTAKLTDFTLLLEGKNKIGISSGASVPRIIVDQLVERIQRHFPQTIVRVFENPEKNIVFALPEI